MSARANNCEVKLKITSFITTGGGDNFGLWFRDLNSVGVFEQRNNSCIVNIPASSDIAHAIEYTSNNPIT